MNKTHQAETETITLEDLKTTIREMEKSHEVEMAELARRFNFQIQLLTVQNYVLDKHWQNIQKTIGWVVLQKLQDLRGTISPPDSQRDVWLEKFFQVIREYRLPAGLAWLTKHYHKILQFERGNISLSELEEELVSEIEPYQAWIAHNELTSSQLNQQRKQTWAYRPLITIVTPVYNPTLSILQETIESVLNQTYDNWQLCLVNGGTTTPGVSDVLNQFAERDERISVIHLPENLGISGNSNEALNKAEGEFIALLDHDDLLAPNMLYEVVNILNQYPETDIIYFDEDKLSADGNLRETPFFKPDWSPHLLLSTNYLAHFICRYQLLLDVGFFDSNMDGAQDWDLALRCVQKTDKIKHVPKILYHWRKVEGSAASELTAKPWAYEAQIRCLEHHLNRLGIADAQVITPRLGLIRVVWPVSGAKVSIIIPTKNKADILLACISSILRLTAYPNYEIILVDNDSTEDSIRHYYDLLNTVPNIKIVDYPGQFNYSTANNLGVKHATGDILLFLNNDTEIFDSLWLHELVGWTERPEVGVVGAKLIRPDGTIQHAGIVMGLRGHCDHVFDGGSEYQPSIFGPPEWYRDYVAVTGACMMMRRDVFEQVGGFDETYQISWSDIEICLRAKAAGYSVIYTPFARLLHHEGASRGSFAPPSDFLRATVQILPFIENDDIYFNPNLSYSDNHPTFAPSTPPDRVGRLLYSLRSLNLINRIDKSLLKFLSDSVIDTLKPRPEPVKGKRRLMFVTTDLETNDSSLYLYMLAQYLAGAGYEITVYSPVEGRLHEKYGRAGVKVEINPQIVDNQTAGGDALILSTLVIQYDLVLANNLQSWRVIHAARAFQKPSIWWLHQSYSAELLMYGQKNVALAFSTADTVIFPVEAMTMLYTPLSRRDNYVVIPYGFDLEIDSNYTLNMNRAKLTIVQVVTGDSAESPDILIKAIANLPQAIRRDISCYFINTPKSVDYKNFHFVDELLPEQVAHYIQSADVLVSSAKEGTLSWVILQAMGLGKAVIATNFDSTAEVIEHQVTGLLVSPDDDQALTICLMRLFHDPEYRRQLGGAARRKFEQELSMEQFGQKIIRIIES